MSKDQKMSEQGYFNLSQIKERGWPPKLVETILGAPDALSINPRHMSGPKIRKYLAARVEAAEADPSVAAVLEKKRQRRSKQATTEATHAAERSRSLPIVTASWENALASALADRCEEVTVHVNRLPIDVLYQRASDDMGYSGTALQAASAVEWATRYAATNLCVFGMGSQRSSLFATAVDFIAGGQHQERERAVRLLKEKIFHAVRCTYPELGLAEDVRTFPF